MSAETLAERRQHDLLYVFRSEVARATDKERREDFTRGYRGYHTFSRFCHTGRHQLKEYPERDLSTLYPTVSIVNESPFLDPNKLDPPLNAVLITEPSQLVQVRDFLNTTQLVGIDTETNVENLFTDRKLRTIQIGDKSVQYVIDLLAFAGSETALREQGNCQAPSWAEPIVAALETACGNTHLKLGHNITFEYVMLRWCLGLRLWRLYDTMVAEKLIHCGRWPLFAKGHWALDDLVLNHLGVAISKEEQKGFDLATPLRQEQIIYAALDCALTPLLHDKQKPMLREAGLLRAAKIQFDSIPAFADAHITGMLLDQDKWLAIVESNEAKHRENLATLDHYFVPVYGTKDNPVLDVTEAELLEIEAKWRNEEKDRALRAKLRVEYNAARKKYKDRVKDSHLWEGEAAFNYGSDKQMLQALRRMGYNVSGVNAKILVKFKGDPLIQAVLEYGKSAKAVENYGRDFLKWVSPLTGRIHSEINGLGAFTGRTNSTKPNVQNIPNGPMRKCFIARPGHKIITTDMSGAELRIMAELSGDPTWLDALAKGWDLHCVGAEMMHGDTWASAALDNCAFALHRKKCKCPEHAVLREGAKTINFQIPYGGSEYALADKLDVEVTEARQLLNKWKVVNKVVYEYLVRSGNFARQKGYSSTCFAGFRRIFTPPSWERATERAAENRKAIGHTGPPSDKEIQRSWHSLYNGIEREGKNTPIQGGNAVIAKLAMGCGFDPDGKPYMWHLLGEYGAELINFVHDEFVVECPDETAERCRDMVQDCIRRAGAEFMKRVVMESEANISDKWEKK